MWQYIGMLLLQVNLGLLTNLHLLLGIITMLPLMERIGSLSKFAQRQNVFICDFIVTMKVYQDQHYKLYSNNNIVFTSDEFWSLNGLMVCNHQQIHVKWVIDYNCDVIKHLVFVLNGEKIWVHLGTVYSKTRMMLPMTQTTIVHVKVDCKNKIPNKNPFSYFYCLLFCLFHIVGFLG